MRLYLLILLLFAGVDSYTQSTIRQDISLNDNWRTISSQGPAVISKNGFLDEMIADKYWKQVNVPHNWDSYEGYRRLLHGNLHGDAWYKKRFSIDLAIDRKKFFLFFEGVSSYAIVFVNGKKVGEHAGGRTSFTIDISSVIKRDGRENILSVHVRHPENITDLPWVCGGCSDERGFSEGSQPFGIFRSVHLIITNEIRVEPFGVHAWASRKDDTMLLSIENTVKNYSGKNQRIFLVNQLVDKEGNKIEKVTSPSYILKPGDSLTIRQKDLRIANPQLWSPGNPYLYKIITWLATEQDDVDWVETNFGFRTINWKSNSHQFYINDKPFFLNGIAEYEHLFGQSHAFSNEQVHARMNWIKSAGFNAFRDAHQPHNLLYGQLCDSMGILWWTQFSAHIWYDSIAFRNNFKQLLKEWIIERRNDPSVILWGLQNESKLPEDFAMECTELIRSLDPTTSSQRLVTSCNGGSGTDWDVPQNWTGTYGGDPATYASDIKKQVLIGEYGAWRTIDLHTEGGFVQNGSVSEDRMVSLMEQKIRLAESVKDSCAGQFFWLLSSHDNPGRVQGGEGLRELDRIGPVNYKGLLTPWEEPTDAYYMFRSNYALKETSAMVYIVSHTWPGRWMTTGKKNGIIVYSNCDEVELFNDVDHLSLGKRKRNGIGTHFQWDDTEIDYNVLYAIGYVDGKVVARDTVILHHLPKAPHFDELYTNVKNLTTPQPGYNYIYRINCGGPDYKDENGSVWLADESVGSGPPIVIGMAVGNLCWTSHSWTDKFPGMPAFFGSQRRTFDPIKGTKDWQLFQDFRYGKDQLKYEFPLPDGEYTIELYFVEPWLGIGGGMDATRMRLFDVAINNKIVLHDLDIWKEAGTNTALKKVVTATITGGKMVISFPDSPAGEAIISAIAIASVNKNIHTATTPSLIKKFAGGQLLHWIDIGNHQYSDASFAIHSLPPVLYGADWMQFSRKPGNPIAFQLADKADVFIAIDKNSTNKPVWLNGYEDTQTEMETDEHGGKMYEVFRKRFPKDVIINIEHTAAVGAIIILPVTNMQPAYDLKPVNSYKTNVASISPGIKKETVGGRECVVVKVVGKTNVQWLIQTGVADIYSITIKYYYPGETKRTGKVQLVNTGGTMMLSEPVTFTFTRPGKWNMVTFNTHSMINAGNYIVKLELENAEGLAISGIDVQ